MNEYFNIFDAETDGLLDDVTKAHCLSYSIYHNGVIIESESLTTREEYEAFFKKPGYFVCHNLFRFDKPMFEKVYGIDLSDVSRFIDTLGISWYLFPEQKVHGLAWWGDFFGIRKPEIDDWINLTLEQYIFRCEEDVKINVVLFQYLLSYMYEIYNHNFEHMMRMVRYSNFKMECLQEQEEYGIPFDRDTAQNHLFALEEEIDVKTKLLQEVMPETLGTILRTKPKRMFKKDGSLSTYGERWVEETSKRGLSFDVEEIRDVPNPGSHNQLKAWLDMLGWEPRTFKVSKATGEPVPQVSLPFGQGLCESVKDLYEIEPNLVELEGYFMIKHRIGVFKSFLDSEKDGKLFATAHGFTNTMRFTHSKPLVNLPKVGVYYGKEIRECLITPDSQHIMYGSDISSLEDSTKQHYIYFFDPEYVNEMRIPGFDPHLDIGVLAGLMTKEESEFYKWAKSQETLTDEERKSFKRLDKLRHTAKTANFAATYGALGLKISEIAKIPLEEGEALYDTYWERNAAIKKVADSCEVKTVRFANVVQKWLYNPLSGFWMYLKAEKDRFSTLNQSSGVYVFDTWLRICRQKLKEYAIPNRFQYHDEKMGICHMSQKNIVEFVLHESMREVNELIHLNVEITVDIDWGNNYSECH